MILVADNDYLHKLAACDLLDDIPDILGADSVLVNSTAKFKFKSLYKRSPADPTYIRLSKFLQSCDEISSEHDNTDLESLALVPNIDQGEALLISVAINLSDAFLLATADKRCLKALTGEEELSRITPRLEGKVECLETTLLRLLSRMNIDILREKILPATNTDAMLRSVFTSNADLDSISEGLRSYLNELRGETGGLLVAVN